jgi:hypothetical protein
MVNYLVDGYTIYAASALAGNAVIRALFGAALYVFGNMRESKKYSSNLADNPMDVGEVGPGEPE